MINNQLLHQYITERKLLDCDKFNVVDTMKCHCEEVENYYYMDGATHPCAFCEYWDLSGIYDTAYICINPSHYNGWINDLRDRKIDNLIL